MMRLVDSLIVLVEESNQYLKYISLILPIIINPANVISSETHDKPTKTNFLSYQKAIVQLSDFNRKVPVFIENQNIFVDRFNESMHQIYCEPLATNLRNSFIAGIKGNKKYIEESVNGLPMIIGEYKRLLTNRDRIKVRTKMGTFNKKSQQSIIYHISPWVSFPTSELSSKEKTCLLKKVIGSAYFVKLSRNTILREAPQKNATVISEVSRQPLKLTGFVNEKDYRWWIFLDTNSINGEERFLYAKNSAQFIIDSSFDKNSHDCDSSTNNSKYGHIFKKNRHLFQRNMKNQISKQGFYYSFEPNVFGVQLFKICQEVDGNNISYQVHFELNGKRPMKLSHVIEFRFVHGGKIKHFDITGELITLSKKFLIFTKNHLVEFN